MYLIYIDDE